MRARRFHDGAMKINNVKLSFKLDEDGRPVDCTAYEQREANALIEEVSMTMLPFQWMAPDGFLAFAVHASR